MFACTHASFCAPATPYNKTILFTHGYHLLLPFSLSPSLLPPPSILSPTSTFSYVPPPLPTSSSLLCPPYVPSSTFLFPLRSHPPTSLPPSVSRSHSGRNPPSNQTGSHTVGSPTDAGSVWKPGGGKVQQGIPEVSVSLLLWEGGGGGGVGSAKRYMYLFSFDYQLLCI